MRRFILVVMMVLLPLQWTWAVAASICAHEQNRTHFGHHEHQHAGADDLDAIEAFDAPESVNVVSPVAPASDASDGPAVSLPHADCHVCHGVGSACLAHLTVGQDPWPGAGSLPIYGRFLPEPPFESFFRPPLAFVA